MTPANDDEVAVSIPFDDRPRSEAKPPPNFGRN